MKRSREKEMMDLPGNPPALLEADLANLRLLNRALGGYRGVLRGLRFFLGAEAGAGFSLLDVGTGNGDIPVVIARWAREKGIAARIIALESDPVTAAVARRQTRDLPEISVVRADAFCPPFSTASFDFVLCSQFLHHFSEEEIVLLLRRWSGLARRGLLISDLVRHPVAYFGIRLLTSLFTRNEMTRTDAPLSVLRAFTVAEWKELFRRATIGEFRLLTFRPFRFLASFALGG